jgi:hypothetical protein
MATNANWTVIFEDKMIIKQTGSDQGSYVINDDSFWNDPKWSNVWAIQFKDDDLDYNDSVEYRDETPHASWNSSGLGDFQSQFISRWDSAHLARLQSDWDADVLVIYSDEGHDSVPIGTESEADQITRKGSRPTSYSS